MVGSRQLSVRAERATVGAMLGFRVGLIGENVTLTLALSLKGEGIFDTAGRVPAIWDGFRCWA